jgi:hypothetical protein
MYLAGASNHLLTMILTDPKENQKECELQYQRKKKKLNSFLAALRGKHGKAK